MSGIPAPNTIVMDLAIRELVKEGYNLRQLSTYLQGPHGPVAPISIQLFSDLAQNIIM